VPVAQLVLGVPLLPDTVRQAVAQDVPHPDAQWEGAPVWNTAYVTALRPVAMARLAERRRAGQEGGAQAFNARWHQEYLAKPDSRLLQTIGQHAYKGAEVMPEGGDDEIEAAHNLYAAVRRAARNILIANNVVVAHELPSDTWADQDGPRAALQAYFKSVLRWFSINPPREKEPTVTGREPTLKNALALIGPTGVGKTLVGGNYLAAARIGEQRPDGQRRRAIWITVSQALIRDCLNPNKTLQRSLPEGATTTAIWEGHKDASSAAGDLVCVTVQSFEEALEEGLQKIDVTGSIEEALEIGLIQPDEIDAMFFDEAHNLSPRLIRLLERFDCPKLLLTATPKRSERRSLLNEYHYVRPMERREAIEKDLLAAVRMLTLRAETIAHAEHVAALSAVTYFVKEGKKCIVYCQPGGGNAQAQRVAALINIYAAQLMGSDYNAEYSYAAMVGSAQPASDALIQAFEQQAHGGALTTSQMLREGWDPADLDGAIWVGDQGDFLALEQESGRPLRPKAGEREALLIEVLLPIPEGGAYRPRYCLAQTVGLEYVPGAEIVLGKGGFRGATEPPPVGDTDSESANLPPPATPWPESSFAPPAGAASPPPRQSSGGSRFTGTMPEELRQLLVEPGTSIAEIIIAPDRRHQYIPPPQYSVTDTELAARYNVSVAYVRYHLEERGGAEAVSYKLIRRLPLTDAHEELGEREYQRYYHAEHLRAHLQAHPMPTVSDERIFARNGLARMLNVPENMIDDAISVLQLPDREPTRAAASAGVRGGRQAPRYSLAEMRKIEEWIQRIPEADIADKTYAEVEQRFPFAKNFIPRESRVLKRHHRESERKGTDLFVADALVRAIEAEHARRKRLVPLGTIAARAGVAVKVVERALTDKEEEVARQNRFTPPGGTRHARHLPQGMAANVEERVRPRPLAQHEVTLVAILSRVNAHDSTLRRFIDMDRHPVELRSVPGIKATVGVYDLSLMQAAEGHFGLRPGQPAIDYDRMRTDVHHAHQVKTEILGLSSLSLVQPPQPPPEEPPEELAGVQAPLTGMSIAEIMEATGRSHSAVTNAIRQWDMEDRVRADRLDDADALQVMSLLSGGRTRRREENPALGPTSSPPTATQPVPAAPSVTPLQADTQPSATEDDASDWQSVDSVMEDLHCSRLVINWLIAEDPTSGKYVRSIEETLELNKVFVKRLAARCKKLSQTTEGWIRHERLAEGLGTVEIMQFLQERNIGYRASEIKVVRVYSSGLWYDLAYAPRLWKAALKAAKYSRPR
jgi:superfamily II DNA or RNA helicase